MVPLPWSLKHGFADIMSGEIIHSDRVAWTHAQIDEIMKKFEQGRKIYKDVIQKTGNSEMARYANHEVQGGRRQGVIGRHARKQSS